MNDIIKEKLYDIVNHEMISKDLSMPFSKSSFSVQIENSDGFVDLRPLFELDRDSFILKIYNSLLGKSPDPNYSDFIKAELNDLSDDDFKKTVLLNVVNSPEYSSNDVSIVGLNSIMANSNSSFLNTVDIETLMKEKRDRFLDIAYLCLLHRSPDDTAIKYASYLFRFLFETNAKKRIIINIIDSLEFKMNNVKVVNIKSITFNLLDKIIDFGIRTLKALRQRGTI